MYVWEINKIYFMLQTIYLGIYLFPYIFILLIAFVALALLPKLNYLMFLLEILI